MAQQQVLPSINVEFSSKVPLQTEELEAILQVSYKEQHEEIRTPRIAISNGNNFGLSMSIQRSIVLKLIQACFQIDDNIDLKYKRPNTPNQDYQEFPEELILYRERDNFIAGENQPPRVNCAQSSQSGSQKLQQKQHIIQIKVIDNMCMPTETEDNDEDEDFEDMLNNLEGSGESDNQCEEELHEEETKHAQNQNLNANAQSLRLINEENSGQQSSVLTSANQQQTPFKSNIDANLAEQIIRQMQKLEAKVDDQTLMMQKMMDLFFTKESPKQKPTQQKAKAEKTVQKQPKPIDLGAKSYSTFVGHQQSGSMSTNTINEPRKSFKDAERPDIIFAYANVFGKEDEKKNFVPFKQRQIINPDDMFEKIVQETMRSGRALTVEKRILNWFSFSNIIEDNPRILFIMCHGMRNRETGVSQFLFESEKTPYLSEPFDEDKLMDIKACFNRSQIDLIVLSTCHSEQLGKILLNLTKPAPAIIAINAQEQVLQWSTIFFNVKLIKRLIQGESIEKAFEASQASLNAGPKEETKICCCLHSHDDDCLFMKQVKKLGSFKAAHEKFCIPKCKCYDLIKKNYGKPSDDQQHYDKRLWQKIKEKHAISHEWDCKEYHNFYRELKSGIKVKTEELEDLQFTYPNFVQKPLQGKPRNLNQAQITEIERMKQKQFNYWCCCRSQCAHRESDKFILVNQLPQAQPLYEAQCSIKKQGIFEEAEQGKVTVKKPSFKNIEGLKDNYPNSFSRKEQVKILLDFIHGMRDYRGQKNRLAIVYGPRGVGKLDTVAKAVWYAKEHEQFYQKVTDGAYLINLSPAKNMRDIFRAIKDRLQLEEVEPERANILQSARLKQDKCLLVFEGLEEGTDIQKEFLNFLVELAKLTDDLKIIFLVEETQKLPLHVHHRFEMIEISYLTKAQAVEYLSLLIQSENKSAFVEAELRNQHEFSELEIFNVWENHKYNERFAREIVDRLCEGVNLSTVATQLNQMMEQEEENKVEFQIFLSKESLQLRERMNKLKQADYTLLISFLYIISLWPGGVCFTELRMIGQKLIRDGTIAEGIDFNIAQEKKDQRIDLYKSILKNESCYSEQAMDDIIDHEETKEFEELWNTEEEQQLKQEEIFLKQQLNFLRCDILNKFDDEVKVRLDRLDLESMREILNIEQQQLSKQQLFTVAINFYTPYANYILIKLKERNINSSFASITVQSANLFFDLDSMWQLWKPKDIDSNQSKQPLEAIFKEKFSHVKVNQYSHRIEENKANIIHLLQKSTIEDYLPELLSEAQAQEFSRNENVEVWNQLQCLSVLLPSILAKMCNYDEAISCINQAKDFLIVAQSSSTMETIALLNLMHASFRLHQHIQDKHEKKAFLNDQEFVSEFEELQERAQESFQNLTAEKKNEGQAELNYLQGIFMQLRQRLNSAQINDENQGTRSRANSTVIQDEEEKVQKANDGTEQQYLKFLKEPSINEQRQAKEYFKKAMKSFHRKNFGMLKCKYELVKMKMQKAAQLTQEELNSTSVKSRKKNKKKQKEKIFEAIKELENRTNKVLITIKIKTLIKSKKDIMNTILVYCNYFRAQIYLYLKEFGNALQFIQRALKKSVQQCSGNEKARQFKQKLKLSKSESSGNLNDLNSKSRIAEFARENSVYSGIGDEYSQVFSELAQELTNLKKQILQQLHDQSSNMFTFMKAQPIIQIKKSPIDGQLSRVAISDKQRSNYPFVSAVKKRLVESKRDLQVKFDILTKQAFKDVLKQGTKLLHLTSDVVQEQYIVFEDELGESKSLNMSKFGQILQDSGVESIDVVSIALPQGKHIASAFINQNTKFALCFDKRSNESPTKILEEDELIQPRLNFIYVFCTEFYGLLAEGQNVREAFQQAKQFTEDQKEQIWQPYPPPQSNDVLDIEPFLLKSASAAQVKSLHFDTATTNVELIHSQRSQPASLITINTQEESKNSSSLLASQQLSQQIKVFDTSKMRGQLIGIVSQQSRYFGQKLSLHVALKLLMKDEDPPLVLVKGKGRVGKARFLQEICSYFYMHNEFRHVIFLQDLAKIDSEEKFSQLIQKLKDIVKSQQLWLENQANENIGRNILWAFTNIDLLKQRFWKRLEYYLYDIYHKQEPKDIRIVMSLNSDNKRRKLKFKSFYEEKHKGKKEIKAQYQTEETDDIQKVQKIYLNAIDEEDALDFLISNCCRRLTQADFQIDSQNNLTSNTNKAELVLQTEAFQQAKSIPMAILKLASKLKDHQNLLCQLRVHIQDANPSTYQNKYAKPYFSVQLNREDPNVVSRSISINNRLEQNDNKEVPVASPVSILKNRHKFPRQKSNASDQQWSKQNEESKTPGSGNNQSARNKRGNKQVSEVHNFNNYIQETIMASDLSSSEHDPRSRQNSGKKELLLKEDESPAKNYFPIQYADAPSKFRNKFKKQTKKDKQDYQRYQQDFNQRQEEGYDEVQLKEAIRQNMLDNNLKPNKEVHFSEVQTSFASTQSEDPILRNKSMMNDKTDRQQMRANKKQKRILDRQIKDLPLKEEDEVDDEQEETKRFSQKELSQSKQTLNRLNSKQYDAYEKQSHKQQQKPRK